MARRVVYTLGRTRTLIDVVPLIFRPFNLALPVISGGLFAGGTLTTTDGEWSGDTMTATYQWKSNGTIISFATASTYVLTAAEVGTYITVDVFMTNAAGTTKATSLAVGPIEATSPLAGQPMGFLLLLTYAA